ncbi:hypothetical protein JCM9743_17040 [Natrinema sp. JCM 9743]
MALSTVPRESGLCHDESVLVGFDVGRQPSAISISVELFIVQAVRSVTASMASRALE